jgi:glutamate racemase
VEPGATAAVESTRTGHVAVIATEATIERGAYQDSLQRLCPGIRVTARACSLLVPLAEEGWLDGRECESVIARYLHPIFQGRDAPDCLLLGCTHFPLLLAPIRKVLGPDAHIVDSAESAAQSVLDELASTGLLRVRTGRGKVRFFTTDAPERFARTGSLFLGASLPIRAVRLVDL